MPGCVVPNGGELKGSLSKDVKPESRSCAYVPSHSEGSDAWEGESVTTVPLQSFLKEFGTAKLLEDPVLERGLSSSEKPI